MKRTLNVHSDTDHGWLEVAQGDLDTLGIAEQISAYSCQDGDKVYLEEDCDKHLFLKAAAAAGWSIETVDCYTQGYCFVRNLPSYQP